MHGILVYIAVEDGRVKRSSLEVLSHARELASRQDLPVEAMIVAPDAFRHTDEVARFGARTVYPVEPSTGNAPMNRALVQAMAAVIEAAAPMLVAFASTEAVRDILGALAVQTGGTVLSDVSAFDRIDGGVEAIRPVLAARTLARTRAFGAPVLVSVRPGSHQATESPAVPEVVPIGYPSPMGALVTRLREIRRASSGKSVDLTEADVVVAAGRGVRDEAGRQLILDLAEVLEAAVGATRAVIEAGLFPASAQIGQTGKVIAPRLYVAAGISGAIQHAAGITNSRVIVAINRDPDAPIFQYATYGLVGDLYQIVPLLTSALKRVGVPA